jgi:uncharacterized protein (DUF885 family)
MKSLVLLALCAVTGLPALTCAGDADRAQVTALADRYLAEFKSNFPLTYEFSGLPTDRHDGLDTNDPARLRKWHDFEKALHAELKSIQPDAFAGEPQWVTWHFLNQVLRQDAATGVCRNELWSVSAFGWQASLSQIAGIQPVGDAATREQALTRWKAIAAWVDQEIANLKEGQRLGFSATQATAKATLGQLDGFVDAPAQKSGYLDVADRAKDAAFAAEWHKVIEASLLPALKRYRNFLRDVYLPRARTVASIESHPDGRECYRGLIFGTTTLEADPVALFDVAVKEVERERSVALQLGRKIYGTKATDYATLAKLMREDPKNRFATSDEVRDYTQRVYEHAFASANKVVLTPPVGQVKLEPFPDYQQESAPGGQYLPAAEDGSRVATYFYRNVPKDLYRASLQNVILHETIPGHHLQIAFLTEHGRKANHPLARLLYFSGPTEGWATYAEDFSNEIGLYDSDLDYIGRFMGSVTPMMVVDLGMQVKGWSVEQAVKYLQEAMPMRPPERAPQSVATISGLPAFVLAYPMGGMEWEKIRARTQAALGSKFDVRAFHQMELQDGMLPFAALEAKAQRWVKEQSR